VVGDRLEDPTPRRSAVYVAVIEQLVSARCTARVDASMPCWSTSSFAARKTSGSETQKAPSPVTGEGFFWPRDKALN
jgi:hypothetical protein